MPRFSLVVPTLQRADTLLRTLETLVAQPGRDVEVVVQNNGNDSATREVVDAIGDDRVRLFQTNDVKPMIDNWELALGHAEGEFVMFVGDDDGVMPDACTLAGSILDRNDAEILSWDPLLYLWPEFFDRRRAGRLYAQVSSHFGLQRVAAGPLLDRFYAFALHYAKLPMIYHAFVARTLIERVRAKHGRYFLGSLPDVTSGIVNAASVETFLRSTRPLSVAGLSHNSGGQHVTRVGTAAPRDRLERDFPRLGEVDEISASGNLELMIGTDMARVREELQLQGRVAFDERGLVRAMARAINDAPERYESTRDAIAILAGRVGMTVHDLAIPDRAVEPAAPVGLQSRGPYENLLVIDGRQIGVVTISDAVRLAAQLVPGPERLDASQVEALAGGPPPLTPEPLGFGKGENGASALLAGWGEPEEWGAWSVDREATCRLVVPPHDTDLQLAVRYRSIPLPDGAERLVECLADRRSVGSWRLSVGNFRGELVVDIGRVAHDAVELTFVNHDLRSPFELGIGGDTRPLGIGLEQIRLPGAASR